MSAFGKSGHMAGNIGVEVNLAVGIINVVPPNFIPPAFNKMYKKFKFEKGSRDRNKK